MSWVVKDHDFRRLVFKVHGYGFQLVFPTGWAGDHYRKSRPLTFEAVALRFCEWLHAQRPAQIEALHAFFSACYPWQQNPTVCSTRAYKALEGAWVDATGEACAVMPVHEYTGPNWPESGADVILSGVFFESISV